MYNGFKPFEIVDGQINGGLILICDHARNFIPPQYGTLGLEQSELNRHIAYDIGAEAVTRGLASALNAPAIIATFSRLLIDPNRGDDDPTLIRQLYDGTIIPGNYPLSKAERKKRCDCFYRPYHDAIHGMIHSFISKDIIPCILSIHSMTDSWNGKKRPWHVSVLWDSDPRFALPFLQQLDQLSGVCVGENEPYDGALAGDTLYRHCTLSGLSHALLEIRQDLIGDDQGVEKWVNLLAPVIEKVNRLDHNRTILKHTSRTHSL